MKNATIPRIDTTPTGRVAHIAATAGPAELPPVLPEQQTGTLGQPLPAWWPADRPHPRFCLDGHEDGQHPDDRQCWGAHRCVDLSLSELIDMDPFPARHEYLVAVVSQHVAEAQPKIWLGIDETRHGRHLTATEARQMAAQLLAAADEAEATA